MPGALVPAGRVLMRVPASRKYVYAAKAIQYAWRNRQKLKRGARAARSAYRYAKRRRTMRSKVGRRANVAGVKNTAMKKQAPYPTGAATDYLMGRLYSPNFPWPVFNTTNNLIDRQRNIIHLSGIKVCRQFNYPNTAPDIGPIEIHWALLQMKDSDLLPSSLDWQNDFFRDNSTTGTRTANFPTYVGTSPWSMQMNCAPINPNNKVKVLTHRKFVLTRYDGGGNGVVAQPYNNSPSFKRIDRYFKIGRNMNFENDTDTIPQNVIFECFWYNTIEPSNFPADPVAVRYIESDAAHTVYWKNLKS